MAEVITFEGFIPPPRFDAIPWTTAQLEEGSTEEGPWTLIDTFTLSPVDPDPANPLSRSFTTELGSEDQPQWYRIIFLDASGDDTLPTDPIENVPTLQPPVVRAYATVSELQRILKINAPSAAQTVAMQRVLDSAALEIDAELGRTEPYPDAPALVVEVNLERAVEHWHQLPISFGIIGLDTESPMRLARDTWERHAFKLAPLKEVWGLA